MPKHKTYFILLVLLAVIVRTSEMKKQLHEADGDLNGQYRDHGGQNKHKATHQKDTHHKVQHHDRKIGWLHLKEVTGCHCPHGQLCIVGPNDDKPVCVKKHFLRESEKLFRRFHQEKMQQDMMNDASSHGNIHKQHQQSESPHHMQLVMHKHNPSHSSDHSAKNQVLKKPHNHISAGHSADKHHSKVCTSHQLQQMPQRLTVWFRELEKLSQTHHEQKHHRHSSVKKELREHHEGSCKCLESAMHEFRQLDGNHDHHLNQTELADMERNQLEPCLVLYLSTCDHDSDSRLSSSEWCCCFSDVQPPCYKILKEIQKLSIKHPDIYVPQCDKQGFFASEQCHGSSEATRSCWCTDLNGNEIPGTRKRGYAHCGNMEKKRVKNESL